MTYRRAAIPALAGGLLLAAVLWWAGASAAALHLPGSSRVLGIDTASELEHWLAPWSYDPPGADGADSAVDGGGYAVGAGDSGRYLSLYQTAIQIRFGAVFAFFVLGALLLVRRLPPLRGRVWAALLAVWAWGLVAGMLARAVSAPWLIAGQGHGSYRFLPQIASVIASGAQVLVVAALLAAAVTVLLARVTVKGAGPLPQAVVPARAARLAATVGTSLIAVSLVVLSYHPVAAAIQEASTASGLLSDPGDLLRLWLLLGAWAGPEGGSIGDWLLNRVPDVVLLAVVWGPCAGCRGCSPESLSRPWQWARSARPSWACWRASCCRSSWRPPTRARPGGSAPARRPRQRRTGRPDLGPGGGSRGCRDPAGGDGPDGPDGGRLTRSDSPLPEPRNEGHVGVYGQTGGLHELSADDVGSSPTTCASGRATSAREWSVPGNRRSDLPGPAGDAGSQRG